MGQGVSDLSINDLGRLSVNNARSVFAAYDKDGSGVLERKEALAFLKDVLKRQPPNSSTPTTAEELLARLDQNGDGCLSWTELTGISYLRTGHGRAVMAFMNTATPEEKAAALTGSGFRLLNKDARGLVLIEMCRLVNPSQVAAVCRLFHDEVEQLQRQGRVKSPEWHDFEPNDARELGQVTCPFPTLTANQLNNAYSDKPWCPNMNAYMAEMEHRPLRQVSFKEIFFFTDSPATDGISMTVTLNGKKAGSFPMSSARDDFWFSRRDSPLYQEAIGAVPKEAAPVYEGFWNEFLRGKYDTYEKRVDRHNQHQDFMSSYKSEIVAQVEANEAILAQAEKQQATVLHCECSWMAVTVPKGSTYSKTVMKFTFHRKSYEVGSVSVALGTFGWLQSEYPHYNAKGDRDLAIKFQSLTPPTHHVDPQYLGARTQIIVTGLEKTIS